MDKIEKSGIREKIQGIKFERNKIKLGKIERCNLFLIKILPHNGNVR